MLTNPKVLKKLDKIESLARATKLRRLFNSPIRYLFGILHRILIYPISKKGKMVNVNTFFGSPMKVLLPSGMDLYLLGGKSHDSEIRLAKFIIKSLDKGNSFLDVGAHYGYFSLLAASIVGPNGKVRSIEASKSTFNVLSRNVKSSSNIKAFNIAISNRKEQLDFYEYPLLYSEYNSLDADQYDNSRWAKSVTPNVIKIEAVPLDDFIHLHGFQPDFIKIDVEGVEDKVVTGMKNLLRSTKKLIISMEYILDENPKSPHDKAMAMMVKSGFSLYLISADGTLNSIQPTQLKSFLYDSKLDSDNIIFKNF
jgi:FkbM family methyltransferase